LGDKGFHYAGDVLDVQPGAVEGTVRGDRGQHLADRRDASFGGGIRALDHH
jgi:hypothetical protein